jgi:hypothetical protein
MAESQAAGIGPNTPIGRVGTPADRAVHPADVNVRHDNARLDPLPDIIQPLPSPADDPVRRPEPLPEGARRQRLADALAARTAALNALEARQQAHLRGRQHVADCQKRAAAFVGLERDIALSVTAQLRGSDGKPVLGEFETALHDRAVADAALTAATAAEQTLLTEHAQATTTWQEADRRVKQEFAGVVAIAGFGQLHARARELRAQLDAVERTIRYTDINEDHPLGKALLADPLNAAVDIQVNPDAAPAPTPVRVVVNRVRVANPDGTMTEPIDEADFWAAQRAATLAAAGDTESFAIREQRAKALANRPINTDGEAA